VFEQNHEAWYVVHTKVRKEQYAEWQLSRRGVVTFLPWIMRPSRVTLDDVVQPLFPGYLFARVNLAMQYWDVVWAPGVHRLVGFGDSPSYLDDGVVDFLRQRAGHDGVVRMFPVFREGDRVRIKQGPLAGLVGIIEKPCSGRGRVRVLMELLRRQTRVEVPERLLDHLSE
jgi:transcriptional antiterminator RfaH